jgi:hypothetical protein
MANNGLMAVSVVMGFLVIISMHWNFPTNALSQVVSGATSSATISGGFMFGPVLSFTVGILIEYSIVVAAIYLFLRSILKSFRG